MVDEYVGPLDGLNTPTNTIQYTWNIIGLRTTNVGNTDNVIVQVDWMKTGTDTVNNVKGVHQGTSTFSSADAASFGPDFVPFEQLTENMVIDWIKKTVVGAYETVMDNNIKAQIKEQLNPVVNVDLPWSQSNT